jgi:hypothetical protein
MKVIGKQKKNLTKGIFRIREKILSIGYLVNFLAKEKMIRITFRYRRYKLMMYQDFQPIGQQIANNIS